jgi:MFS family permease
MIPLAVFSDRFGRKPAMLLSTAFIMLPNFMYTRVGSWEQLIPLKMLSSVGDLFFGPAQSAMIADLYPSEKRGKMYSIVEFAHPIGSIPVPS